MVGDRRQVIVGMPAGEFRRPAFSVPRPALAHLRPACAEDVSSAVGVRRMKEPGFAAHDSHLYAKGFLVTPSEQNRDAGNRKPLPYPQVDNRPPEYFYQQHHHNAASYGQAPNGSVGHGFSEQKHFPQGIKERTSTHTRHVSSAHSPYPALNCQPELRRRRRRDSPRSRSSEGHSRRSSSKEEEQRRGPKMPTDFRGALARFGPPAPPSLLRKIASKDVQGLGKVRVVLRVSPAVEMLEEEKAALTIDHRRRQVTLVGPNAPRVGVSAPKMFAFDQVYDRDDSQADVTQGAVVDVLHAVLEGNDGCVISFGAPVLGKTHTMLGSNQNPSQLGVIPTAISWLYRAIVDQKSKTGARFSVRVSSVAVDAVGITVRDLLSQFSKENEPPPGALLRDRTPSLLSSVAEVRAPSPETAAYYLDVALSGRGATTEENDRLSPGASTFLYTLHVYQYAVDKNGKGGVVGGRSRLHLVDIGETSGMVPGSLSLSGLTSVLLAIFNGQKYLPHKENKLTLVLKEAMSSLTCHASVIVHVSPAFRHAQDTLTTLQLASRIHRMRRKKIKGLANAGSCGSSEGKSSGGDTSAESSSIDFSSSEQSCDTVIYVGGGGPGDSTDGEHPPVFMSHHIRQSRVSGLPRLRSLEHLRTHSASPAPSQARRPASASPTPTSRPVIINNGALKPRPPPRTVSTCNSTPSPKPSPLQTGFFRHQPGVSQVYYPNENQTTFVQRRSKSQDMLVSQQQAPYPFLSSFKPSAQPPPQDLLPDSQHISYSAYQEPNTLVPTFQNGWSENMSAAISNTLIVKSNEAGDAVGVTSCPTYKATSEEQWTDNRRRTSHEQVCRAAVVLSAPISDEHWVDGPKINRKKAPVSNIHSTKGETWVDGPQAQGDTQKVFGYGFMDDHKKSMIEKWVAVQSAQVTNNLSSSSDVNKPPLVEPKAIQGSVNQGRPCEESTNESDTDTLSEDPSAPAKFGHPNLIEELEKKNLIPPVMMLANNEDDLIRISIEGKESTGGASPEPSMEDICSQCEALAEECEELSSLLSCEEEECKRQTHQGLATVIEEPELESAVGTEDADVIKSPATRKPATPTAELGVQVCEEDILKAIADITCSESLDTDDHPLRVLSEENLTCASTFTSDSYSQAGGDTAGEESDEDSSPIGLLEVTEYGKMCQDLTLAIQSDIENKNLLELAKIHELYRKLARQSPRISRQHASPLTALLLTARDSLDGFRAGTESSSICSEPLATSICQRCHKKQLHHGDSILKLESVKYSKWLNGESNTNVFELDDKQQCTCDVQSDLMPYIPSVVFSLASVRHPERASNPNLACHSANANNVIENEENLAFNGNIISGGLGMNNLPQDSEANIILHSPAQCSYSSDVDMAESLDERTVMGKSDNESDCVSEDSEYAVSTSKLSKFLCVGVGRTKSKTPYKLARQSQNRKCKTKENNSKNLIRSPSQVISHTKFKYRWGKPSCSSKQSEDSRNVEARQVEGNEDYDSGHDSGITRVGLPQSLSTMNPSREQLPSRSYLSPQGTVQNNSLGTSTSLCESSGYESIPRDSECSSFSSSQDSEMDEEQKKVHSLRDRAPLKVEQWSEEDIKRYEGRQREIRSRVCSSSLLKTKEDLGVSSESWSFEIAKKGMEEQKLELKSLERETRLRIT